MDLSKPIQTIGFTTGRRQLHCYTAVDLSKPIQTIGFTTGRRQLHCYTAVDLSKPIPTIGFTTGLRQLHCLHSCGLVQTHTNIGFTTGLRQLHCLHSGGDFKRILSAYICVSLTTSWMEDCKYVCCGHIQVTVVAYFPSLSLLMKTFCSCLLRFLHLGCRETPELCN